MIGGSKSALMNSERNSKKRRLHIMLSLDTPLQREAWQILSQANNKTSAVCEAVCGYHKQKSLEDTLRSILREELEHISVSAVPLIAEADEKAEPEVDASVLNFLLALQDDE